VDEHDALHDVEFVTMEYVGNGGDTHRFEAYIPLQRAGSFGYTVRVIPHHELLSTVAELGLVVTA
jgi:starch phosphorylase